MYLDSITKLNIETHFPRHISAKFSETCFIIAIVRLRWIQKQAKYVSVGKVVQNNPCHYFFKHIKKKLHLPAFYIPCYTPYLEALSTPVYDTWMEEETFD